MGIHVNNVKVNDAAATLGCLTLKTFFVYLGTKVGDNMSRVEAWKDIVEKVSSWLSRWKLKTLSIKGRFTLLKSVLGSIPIFHMSIFKVPMSVLQRLESIRSHFLTDMNLTVKKCPGLNGHKLGKGDSTCFWEDKWFEGSALKDMFPRLFALENVKSVTVYKKLNDSGLDYSMRRKPRGGVEEDQYTALSDMMDSIVLTPKEDRFVWSLEDSGDLSVKSI
nr:RNA-directed DNA polymerase, eukaryota, reverse transcriptase zinc-binding domain protein [Tanacetum cinerariifolium]